MTTRSAGGSLTLDGAYLSLAAGQLVAVTGVRADKQGETASEVVSLAGLSLVDGYTVVTFNPPLAGTYVRSTVTINANVAPGHPRGDDRGDPGQRQRVADVPELPAQAAAAHLRERGHLVGSGLDPGGAGQRGGLDGG